MPKGDTTEEARSTSIQGTEVPIDPQTNSPQAGSIVGGTTGAHKIPWTRRDIIDKFPEVEWYNWGPLRDVTWNGVHWGFGGGMIRTPHIIRDYVMDIYAQQGLTERRLASEGVIVAVGQLEPLPRER